MAPKTKRRRTYDIQRKLEQEVRRTDKKRGKINGHVEPSHPRKKKEVRTAPEDDAIDRHAGREEPEVDYQSLVQEIEGTGGLRSIGISQVGEGIRYPLGLVYRGGRFLFSGVGRRSELAQAKRDAQRGKRR